MILTYGGGTPVVQAYTTFGARRCIPIYNALDPSTHFRVEPDQRFSGDLGFLGNRLPDREGRVEGFFFQVAASLPEHRFILGGNGWAGKPKPSNVHYVGHVYTSDHNAFNTTLKAVLNISRDSMARYGYCPATRVFEAAGAAACMITDDWEGIDMSLIRGGRCWSQQPVGKWQKFSTIYRRGWRNGSVKRPGKGSCSSTLTSGAQHSWKPFLVSERRKRCNHH